MLVLNIKFLPDSNREDLMDRITKGTKEYERIWKDDGKKIVKAIKSVSGLKFQETEINAVVYISRSLPSRSFPLSLRADLPFDIKKGLIIHELCHRLLSGNHVRIKAKEYKNLSLEIHKVINLILYDIWVEVHDKELADKMVKWESGLKRELYKKAWDWALSLSKEERKKRFKNFIGGQG